MYKKNEHFRNIEFEIIGKYNRDKSKLLVKNRYGKCLIHAGSLLRGITPTISSAVSKDDYFHKMAFEKNKWYREGYFTIESSYTDNRNYLILRTPYGLVKMIGGNLLKGYKPTIKAAIYKTSYFTEILREKNPKFFELGFKIIGEYINNRIPITLTCKDGFSYSMLSANLLKKAIPETISVIEEDKTPYFIHHAKQIHGNFDDFSKVVYKSNKTKIEIICHRHGSYFISPSSYLMGCRCAKCKSEILSKYNRENPSGWDDSNWIESGIKSKLFSSFSIYIVRLYNDNEEFFKIGKTYRPIENRMKEIFYDYEILKLLESGKTKEAGVCTCKLERTLQNHHKQFKYKPKIKFGGQYECFHTLDWNYINSLEGC